MSVLSYFVPRTVLRSSSGYNRDIRVLEEQGNYKLLVDGSRQSGEYIRELWQHALGVFGMIPSPDVKRILVLGVAGGTVIHMLHALYPDATIDGVDIDQAMIDVGKKYFGLGTVQGLRLIKGDAKAFVERAVQRKNRWDVVIVDLYVGATVPPFVGQEEFLKLLKKILMPHGAVIINYLREFEYERLSDLLSDKLPKVFSEAKDTKIYCNRFFYCR